MKIALLFGGPSLERGISLNSARSLFDHLQGDQVEVSLFYFDVRKNVFRVPRSQLYSNTPSDFDFKLPKVARQLSTEELTSELRALDIVFPVIHGIFGEDGELQRYLEEIGVPFVGSGSSSCRRAFDKHSAQIALGEAGFTTLPSLLIQESVSDRRGRVLEFLDSINAQQVIVKPCRSGSSIGVFAATGLNETLGSVEKIFDKKIDTRVLIEPFCTGTEFTVLVLEGTNGNPIALMPTGIEIATGSDEIFDYRKKYLATQHTFYHTPPRFPDEIVSDIRMKAQRIYQLFGMCDFARFDGWLLPDNSIVFSDMNPISGMEQNSFFFIQSAQIGMSHRDAVRHLLQTACRRHKIKFTGNDEKRSSDRTPVQVIFGGDTAERQVSVLSGTNVWLKLLESDRYEPTPFFLDKNGYVWELPYSLTLYHTTEEIQSLCERASTRILESTACRDVICDALGMEGSCEENEGQPRRMTMNEFVAEASLVFIALHGGIGENGKIQEILRAANVPFTGSGPETSRLGMDKAKTADAIIALGIEGVYTARKKTVSISELERLDLHGQASLWKQLIKELALNNESQSVIVKPVGEGCSAGIARLNSVDGLARYISAVLNDEPHIPAGDMTSEQGIIEMPPHRGEALLFEEFVITDNVGIVNGEIQWERVSGIIEITMALIGATGKMQALNPSITLKSGAILSLEEKFQGGTGVNITPPPDQFISLPVVETAKKRTASVGNALGFNGFVRIDAFLHVDTGDLCIIEANTIPALTPSTVIYHQALAEDPPIYPTELLEKILDYLEV